MTKQILQKRLSEIEAIAEAAVARYKKRANRYADNIIINDVLNIGNQYKKLLEYLLDNPCISPPEEIFFTLSYQSVRTAPSEAKPNQKIKLSDIDSLIRMPALAAHDEIKDLAFRSYEMNEVYNIKEMQKAKSSLPYFLPSGFCPLHRNNDTLQYNRCIQIDIDIKTKGGNVVAKGIKERIISAQLPFILLCCMSPSGYGVKLVVLTTNNDKEMHNEAQRQVIAYLSKYFEIDISWFDVLGLSQPCFLPNDPTAFVADMQTIEPYPFTPQPLPQKQTAYQPGETSTLPQKAAQYLIKGKKDVAGCYNDYFLILCACLQTFGETEGLLIAEAILENCPTYLASNFRKNIQKHAKGMSGSAHKRTGATLVFIARAHGFNL